ncbi:MAG: hypothetical protein R3F59_38350 [Myxococcota bacterium]
MAEEKGETGILEEIGDELRLQAWLGQAEMKNPSLQHDEAREEVSALARLRDQLRVQLHLGKLEAKDEFARLETRWGQFKQLASASADTAEEKVHDVLRDIRDGYRRITG